MPVLLSDVDMLTQLGIARSGYYKWHRQGCTTQQMQADTTLTEQIRAILEQSGQIFDSLRTNAELKVQGIRGSRRRIARLMRQTKLDASPPRRRARTSRADAKMYSVSNLLARKFTADASNCRWLVDVTGIWMDKGWLYLAGVLELFSCRLMGWAMDEHMPYELT